MIGQLVGKYSMLGFMDMGLLVVDHDFPQKETTIWIHLGGQPCFFSKTQKNRTDNSTMVFFLIF